MTEPVTLADFKVHLRLDASVTGEDVNLSGMLLAARRKCEHSINRSIVGAPRTLILDAFPRAYFDGQSFGGSYLSGVSQRTLRARDISLPGGTVASVTSVDYVDADRAPQVLPSDRYAVSLGATSAAISPIGAWPATADQAGAVTIGYVVSPLATDDLAVARQAILLIAGNWYENREGVVLDIRGTPVELPLSVTWLLESLWQPPTP